MGMWVPSTYSSWTLWKLPSAQESIHNFLNTIPLWYFDISMAKCSDNCLADVMSNCTDTRKTYSKKVTDVLYSTFVPSLNRVMAMRCWTEIGFLTMYLFASTGCNSEHKYSKVSLLTLKLRLNSLPLQFPTMSERNWPFLPLPRSVSRLLLRRQRGWNKAPLQPTAFPDSLARRWVWSFATKLHCARHVVAGSKRKGAESLWSPHFWMPFFLLIQLSLNVFLVKAIRVRPTSVWVISRSNTDSTQIIY